MIRGQRLLFVLIVGTMGACNPSFDETKFNEIRKRAQNHEGAVEAMGGDSSRLINEWKDALWAIDQARMTYERTRQIWIAARKSHDQASQYYKDTAAEWENAARRWRFYQALVVAAAALDAHNLERFRSLHPSYRGIKSLDCNRGMSTASFRRLLISQGWDLTGKHIDHIVPVSKGGANHPANYQVLSARKNQQWGNTWNREKCFQAGAACGGAVAVSRKCSNFSGSLP